MSQSDDFLRRQPLTTHPSERSPQTPRVLIANTTWAVWTMTFLPVLGLALNIVLIAMRDHTWLKVGIITTALWALAVVLARADRRELDAWGFENLASPWLVLLTPPVYLAVRGNRVWHRTKVGLGPFWASVAVILLIPAAVVGLNILTVLGSELQRAYEFWA